MVKQHKKHSRKKHSGKGFKANVVKAGSMQGIMTNTIRIARLKLLFIAAKAVKDGNLDKVKYSIHDSRTPAIMRFLGFTDRQKSKVRSREDGNSWLCRFAIV